MKERFTKVQIRKITLIVLAVLTALLIMIPFVSADEAEAKVGLAVETNVSAAAPGLVNVGEGDQLEVTVSMTENTGIYALYFKLDFDASVFGILNDNGIVEVSNVKVPTPYEGAPIVRINKDGSVSANIDFGKVASTYTGELFTVYFNVLKDTHSDISISLASVSAFETRSTEGTIDTEAIEVAPAYLVGHGDALTETRVVEATCLEKGYSIVECSECDFEYRYEETELAEHDFSVQTVDATCTEGGYSTRTCKVCGLSEKFDEVAALGHKEVTIPAVEATAKTEGKTEGKRCERCGLILVEQKTVPATGFNIFAAWWFWLIICLVIIAIVVVCIVVIKKKKAEQTA